MSQDFSTAYQSVVAKVLASWQDANETTDSYADATKAVRDAATNTYQEEFSEAEWIAATLARLDGTPDK